jgi:hypothetical protein
VAAFANQQNVFDGDDDWNVTADFENAIGPIPAWAITQLFIGRASERQLPKDRVERLGITSMPTQKVGGFGGAGWKTSDSNLRHYFGIE